MEKSKAKKPVESVVQVDVYPPILSENHLLGSFSSEKR